MGPVTMHRIGRDGINVKDYDVKENDLAVFFFGEIDVRCHIGVQRDKKSRQLDEIIETLTENYLSSIMANKNQFNSIHLIVCSIVPPSDRAFNPTFPFYGTLEDRVSITIKLNDVLKIKCEKNNIGFIDIYNHYSLITGELDQSKSEDGVHIHFNYNAIIKQYLFAYIKLSQIDKILR
jgi:hypothetical protein